MDVWEHQGPPVHIAVAGYLGLLKKPKKKAANGNSKGDDMGELIKLFDTTGRNGVL